MATRLIAPLYQAIDANGNPGNGWKLAFYETGTVNLKDTYSNGALTIANANPVICNCEGRPANGAGDPVSILGAFREDYKLILLDADDNVIETKDPVDLVTYDINSFDPRPAQHWGTTTGTADALLIKPDTSISSYSDDLLFTIQISIDNNAGSTLAVFEEGTVSTYLADLDMMKYDGAGAKIALEAGDNQAGQTYLYRIDGTDAVCLNPELPHFDSRNLSNATTALDGVVELATDAEVATGTDTTRPIVPSSLLSLFNASLRSADGYLRIPANVGGTFVELIVQWGQDTVAIGATTAFNLPITFPTAALNAVTGLYNSDASRTASGHVNALSTTQITLSNANAAGGPDTISWIAIGY